MPIGGVADLPEVEYDPEAPCGCLGDARVVIAEIVALLPWLRDAFIVGEPPVVASRSPKQDDDRAVAEILDALPWLTEALAPGPVSASPCDCSAKGSLE